MKGNTPHAIIVCVLLAVATASQGSPVATSLPRVFCADPQALATAKVRLATNDPALAPAFHYLVSEADKILTMKPKTVMDKKTIPPSGDKHDFMSQAPYYWRDTNAPNGHYLHRDGQRNPEAEANSDAGPLMKTCADAQTLALAFYFTGDEKYAAKATEIICVWFLNPATRMNPNLNYGQGIPGETEGRPEGLISARGMMGLMDAIGLLAGSSSWTVTDQQAMTTWGGQYFEWLTTNKLALQESRAPNNHGTFYDVQYVALAMFLDKTNEARNLLLKDREQRIARQIEPDGRQPRELVRTLSFDYSLFNLRALFDLASLGKNAGVDLWHYQTADGRSILNALVFTAAYSDPVKIWPYKQIAKPKNEELDELLLRASAVYSDSRLDEALRQYPLDELAINPNQLLYSTLQARAARQ